MMIETGMTDAQYKGSLLDRREDWQDVVDLLKNGRTDKALEKAEKQVEKIDEKMRF